MDRSTYFSVHWETPPRVRRHGHEAAALGGGVTLLVDGAIYGVSGGPADVAARLLESYRRRPDEFFAQLDAQASVVIVEPTRTLAYRTPLGTANLYYSTRALSNHLLPLFRASGKPPLDTEYFLSFLLDEPSLQYDNPRTPFEGIRRLAPGTLLTAANGRLDTRVLAAPKQYWYVRRPEQSVEDVAERVRELLDAAIAKDLGAADTPAVCQLSGGLDSSFVTALVARHTTNLTAFMYSFPSSPSHHFSEKCAREVAASLGIPLTVVTPEDLPAADLSRPQPAGDEPDVHFWQGALFGPVWMRLVPENATMFTGFGADQLFLRDERILPWLLRQGDVRRFRTILGQIARGMERSGTNLLWQSLLLSLPRAWHARLSAPFASWRFNPFNVDELEPESILLEPVTWLRESTIKRAETGPRRQRAEATEGRIAVEMDYLAAPTLSTAPYLAPRGSRVANPYCDARLIDFVLGGVSWDLIHDWKTPYKHVLREAMRGYVPEDVRSRDKNEFVFDGFLGDLVRGNQEFLRSFLVSGALPLREALDTDEMLRALDGLLFGLSSNAGGKLLNLVAYGLWWRDFSAIAAEPEAPERKPRRPKVSEARALSSSAAALYGSGAASAPPA